MLSPRCDHFGVAFSRLSLSIVRAWCYWSSSEQLGAYTTGISGMHYGITGHVRLSLVGGYMSCITGDGVYYCFKCLNAKGTEGMGLEER